MAYKTSALTSELWSIARQACLTHLHGIVIPNESLNQTEVLINSLTGKHYPCTHTHTQTKHIHTVMPPSQTHCLDTEQRKQVIPLSSGRKQELEPAVCGEFGGKCVCVCVLGASSRTSMRVCCESSFLLFSLTLENNYQWLS